MTDSSIQLAGASALASLSPELAVEFSDFNDEQKAILAESVQLGAAAMGATVAWIRSMRRMRDSLLANCQGHTGWERVCKRVYKINVKDANAMLRGLNGWETRFLDKSGGAARPLSFSGDPSPTFFREIGKVKEELRPAVLDALESGEIEANGGAVQRKASLLRQQAKRPVLQVTPPPKPAQLSSTPLAKPKAPLTGRGKTYSYSKYRDLPEGAAELKYLLKKLPTVIEAGNVFARGLNDILKRYQNKAEDDRHLPDYMTMWAQAWREDDKLDYIDQLNQIAAHISSIRRAYELTLEFTVTEGLNLEP